MTEPSKELLTEDEDAYPEGDYDMLDFEGAELEGGEEDDILRDRGGEELTEEESYAKVCKDDDSPEKRRLYREYLLLIRDIEGQNQTVEEIKMTVCEKCLKQCRTRCEEREIKELRCHLEKENLKLQCLIQKAMKLQQEDPNRCWGEIPMVTTFEEDSMPSPMNFGVLRKICQQAGGVSKKPMKGLCSPTASEDISKKAATKYLRCLLEQIKQKGPRGANVDECTLRKMLCALKTPAEPKKRRSRKMSRSCTSMQERLAADNRSLASDRSQLQEELMCRDNMIDSLQKKICRMQQELRCLCQERQKDTKCRSSARGKKTDTTKCLERNIDEMQRSVAHLRMEMECLRKECECWEDQVKCEASPRPPADDSASCASSASPCAQRKTKSSELNELKGNYTYLLAEYAKKDSEIKEMKKRLQGFCVSKEVTGAKNVDECELKMLRCKVCDLNEEQVEFKCLIKEQADQLEDYRKKYLSAQQKVEEQKCVMEKLQMNNQRIEEQINMEMQRIKTKFQEKLNELAQYPKLLENEQLKLASACKEKEDLESKLRLVCKELKSVKAQLDSQHGKPDCTEDLRRCKQTVQMLEQQIEDLKKEKTLLCEQLQKSKDDLDTLRAESARIICGTKERAELTRSCLQDRIDQIEKELAQCRATACLSISDREEVIKEMQGQMSTLSYSFDTAQKQIKTLKNHISFLSNDNCFPIKC